MDNVTGLTRRSFAGLLALILLGGASRVARADAGPFQPRRKTDVTAPGVKPPATKFNPNTVAPLPPTLTGKTTKHQMGGYIELRGANWTPNGEVRFDLEYAEAPTQTQDPPTGPLFPIIGGSPVYPTYTVGGAKADAKGSFTGWIDARCAPNQAAKNGAIIIVTDKKTGFAARYETNAYTCN